MKFLFILSIILFSLTGCGNSKNNIENSQENINSVGQKLPVQNISITRTATDKNTEHEAEIGHYSSPITLKEEGRQQNISISCGVLNGTVVPPGETFSFINTLGQPTPERGYKKADVFDSRGNIVKGYGGGNCQISSTLYNAVLATPNLTVVERYEHSRDVYYVPDGKDAAVSYSSNVDFRFRNDTPFAIKIYSSTDTNNVNISIVKIYYE